MNERSKNEHEARAPEPCAYDVSAADVAAYDCACSPKRTGTPALYSNPRERE